MSIGDTTENAILALVYRATAWANYADNAASSPQTNIGLSLHTADPGDSGTASTNEITYTSYTRVNKTRDSNATTGWNTPAGGSVSPNTNIDFPAGTGGSGTATHFMTAASNATPPTGAQVQLWSGEIEPDIVTGNGITPRLTTASTVTLA